MDYKKILAATAVTSAAFVVPVVASAEEIVPVEKDELIAAGTFSVGDTVKVAVTGFEETSQAEDGSEIKTTDKIVTYEWFIGDATTASATTAELKLPMHAAGQNVKLVVTTEGQKKYYKKIQVETLKELKSDIVYEGDYTSPKINTIITMSNINIEDTKEVISGYEWYLVEGNQNKLLVGENDVDFEIPIEYAGKQILFVVKTESGKYYKTTIPIDPLTVKLDDLEYSIKVNGKDPKPNVNTFLPGDKLEVITPEIVGEGGELLTPEDYEISYKWVAFNNQNNQFALPNATDKIFTLPADSEKQGYTKFKVTVTLTIPTLPEPNSVTKTIEIGASNTPISSMIKSIDALDNSNDYPELKASVESLQEDYSKLNETAKAAITNYSKLTAYVDAFKEVTPITEDFKKLENDYIYFEDSTIKQADLLKRANTLRNSINRLTVKQKNIYNLFEQKFGEQSFTQLHEWIVKIGQDDNDYKTDEVIATFNSEVETFIYNAHDQIYLIESISENDLVNLTAFEETIKHYLDKAKSIDKVYHALLKMDVLKTAQADVKKARAVIEKINKISTLSGKKKASAILAAEKAYNKLSIAQSSLISDETKSILENLDENTGESGNTEDTDTANSLIDKISAILPKDSGAGKNYSDDIDYLEDELADIAVDYKLLTSTQKKLVKNYKSVSQVKKDVSTAKRVQASIVKAEEAKASADEYENDTDNQSKYISKMKSAQSKYNSAYKAYVKLTIEQKSLVDGTALLSAIEEVKGIIDNAEFAGDEDYQSGKSDSVVAKIDGIKTLLDAAEATALAKNGSNDIDSDLQREIDEAKQMYKELDSFSKKLVHNYGLLSMASSHLSKAKSVKKRLAAVTDEKKFISAKKAFDKLLPVQQGLIYGKYQEVSEIYLSFDSSTPNEIDEELRNYFIDSVYDYSQYKELYNASQYMSSSELKALKHYKQYQAMTKDLKAVDSYVAKIAKLGENPTYSQIDTINKSYLKLSRIQQELFKTYEDVSGIDYFILLEQWLADAPSKSADLNQRINAMISYGLYDVTFNSSTPTEALIEFEQTLKNYNSEYKALDSKERKLVANYSYVKAAEKDLKAVRPVVKIKEELDNAEESNKPSIESKLNQAKDKLTIEQTSLYNLVINI